MKFIKWWKGENVLSTARRTPAIIANKAIEKAMADSKVDLFSEYPSLGYRVMTLRR